MTGPESEDMNPSALSLRRALIAGALAAGLLAGAGPSVVRADDPVEPNGATLAEECKATVGQVPEVGGRACRFGESVGWNLADLCRSHTSSSAHDCSRFDGRVVSEAEMAAYEASWVHRALALQRGLDDQVALRRTQWLHTHNSFNAFAYDATVTGLDSNHVYSIRDQLRMGARAIEMDIHWVPSVFGSLDTGGRAVTLCHGQTTDTPVAAVHVGCTNDRPFAHGLAELRHWLDQPENRHEVVMLYLQNELDGDPVAHDKAVTTIEAHLGDLVYRPPAGEPCAPLPLDQTKVDMRATGGRVLLVGNCGPGAWGTLVHQRGPHWDEAASDPGDDYAPDGCAAERESGAYDSTFVRRYEDATIVSYWMGAHREVTTSETGRMVACGVNWIGFDMLEPGDPRLEAMVWSWAPDQPASRWKCAVARPGDGRFETRSCGVQRAAACRTAEGVWAVTTTRQSFAAAGDACAEEFPGSVFGVPANGYEHGLLVAARSSSPEHAVKDVFVAYSRSAGDWAA